MRSRLPLLFLLVVTTAVVLPVVAHAASIPFFGPIIPDAQKACPGSWSLVITVINNIILFMLTITIVFVAPIMIAYAGFLFVVNPVNPGGIQKAKDVLINTISGIVIALAAWAIVTAVMAALYNPDPSKGLPANWRTIITSGNIEPCIPLASVLRPAAPGDMVGPPAGVVVGPSPVAVGSGEYTHEEAIAALNSGITTNKPGCTLQTDPNCTSLTRIPRGAIDGINAIQAKCGCSIVISGGTEVGHASHGPGIATVDMRLTQPLLSAIQKVGYTINAKFGPGATCEPGGGSRAVDCYGSSATIIHMEL